MKDFSAEWPVLTRFGEHEAIMNRLALYMDWSKVEEPEQADLLLEHYKKDVGRLVRTLTAARTPTPEMAAAVMELAEKNSEPQSAALRIMFFVFRLMNMAQGIPLRGTEDAVTPEKMTRLLELAMGMIESTAYTGKLPCTECYEWQDSIPDLLLHMRSKHPYLNEGAETMTQENDGGETQTNASAEVEAPKTHEEVVAAAKAAEAESAQSAEGASAEVDDGAPPETTDAPPAVADEPEIDADAGKSDVESEKESDPTALDDVGGDGPPVPGPDAESEPDANKPESDISDAVFDPTGKPTVDEVARKNCIAIIAAMNDVTTHNHTKPQSWWADNLFTLHQFIIGV